eukprot:3411359-Amphidinium_carterae.1
MSSAVAPSAMGVFKTFFRNLARFIDISHGASRETKSDNQCHTGRKKTKASKSIGMHQNTGK